MTCSGEKEVLLIVEGEPLNIDLAHALEDGRRLPCDHAGVVKSGFGGDGDVVVVVRVVVQDDVGNLQPLRCTLDYRSLRPSSKTRA